MQPELLAGETRPRRWRLRRRRVSAVAFFTALAMFAAAPARAGDFYNGKTIELLIGFSSGGGYDLYGRTLARYLGRIFPAIRRSCRRTCRARLPQAVNYLYNVAPKDGTAIGFRAGHRRRAAARPRRRRAIRRHPIRLARQRIARGQRLRLHGLDRHRDACGHAEQADRDRCVGWWRRKRRIRHRLAQHVPHADPHRHRLSRRTEITLAMQRHEVDGRCGWSWTSLLSRNKAMLTGKEVNVALQIALNKDDDPYRSACR